MQSQTIFDEGPVAFSFQGKAFFAAGSSVTELCCNAYLGEGRKLTSSSGQIIGHYRLTSWWPTPRSFVSSRCYQVLAFVGGRTYTGRSAGIGMLFRGRRIASEKRRLAKVQAVTSEAP